MMAAHFSTLRLHLIVAAFLAHLISGTAPADEQAVTPSGTIQPTTTGSADRVDPSISRRLSLTERERLYDKVVRDARQLEMQGTQLRRLSVLLRPAVVHIDAIKSSSRGRPTSDDEQEAGSGVIANLADKVVVITNRHVIHGADMDDITIRLDDGREIQPSRVWTDSDTDIGVMLINESHLPTAHLAEGDGVQIGDTVLAIGSPFGLAHSVTLGIVSAKGRRDLELGEGGIRFQNFIQTDAAINPGNSGGPLVNLRGEVVGLNTCIASNSGGFEGIGFAIPISMVMFVARQLVETGTVSRAYLGVALDKTFSLATAHKLGMTRPVGARVTGITPGSPAEEIGLMPNDIILEFAGNPIEDDDHLVSVVSMTPTNQEVRLRIFRNGQPLTLEVTVASRKAFESP